MKTTFDTKKEILEAQAQFGAVCLRAWYKASDDFRRVAREAAGTIARHDGEDEEAAMIQFEMIGAVLGRSAADAAQQQYVEMRRQAEVRERARAREEMKKRLIRSA